MTLSRIFLTTLLLGFVLPASAETDRRPNILFIAIDDLNDWIGCLGGHPQAVTPNLDKLSREGVLFTNAHCAAPACNPSRAAVFSGQRPEQTGVFSNDSPRILKTFPEKDLFPAHLAASGYETLGTGKLLHGGGTSIFQHHFQTEQRWSPFTKKQATYQKKELASKGTNSPRHVIKGGPGGRDWILPFNGLRSERNPDSTQGESFDWAPVDVDDSAFGDTRITDWAIARLMEPRRAPFLLAVGYYRPHIPLFAPQQDFDVYPPVDEILLPKVRADDLDDLSEVAKKWATEAVTAGSHDLIEESGQWREAVRAYLACVTFADRQIGRLLAQLEKSPAAENTWIIVWSDHGWHLGEKRHWGKWGGWSNSTRVPLIVVPPKSVKSDERGRRCDEPVSLIDLYPTLIEIAQAPPKEKLAGKSLLPLIEKPDTLSKRVVRTTFDRGNIALTTRDWRYIRYATGEEELYNTERDPHEWDNLAKDTEHSDTLGGMRSSLADQEEK